MPAKKPVTFRDSRGVVQQFESIRALADFFGVYYTTAWVWIKRGYKGINDVPPRYGKRKPVTVREDDGSIRRFNKQRDAADHYDVTEGAITHWKYNGRAWNTEAD